jgi:hypothetical protein
VLEGVLATVTPIIEEHRFRTNRVIGHEIDWHDAALKRLAVDCRRYPQVGFAVVTFVSEAVRDEAADFLSAIPIDVEAVEFQEMARFRNLLRFDQDVQQIIDSDPARLNGYGQRGRSVIPGSDWG